jgi:hypothetical protein
MKIKTSELKGVALDWVVAIKEKAQELAEGLFYSDANQRIPWEPFEDYSDEWVLEQCKKHVSAIEKSFLTLLKEIEND